VHWPVRRLTRIIAKGSNNKPNDIDAQLHTFVEGGRGLENGGAETRDSGKTKEKRSTKRKQEPCPAERLRQRAISVKCAPLCN